MKKIIAIIIPFITFFAGISVYYAHDINGAFNIYSNGEQGEYTIGGFTYAYYDYTCSNCNNNSPSTAYCLDAHVQFGGSGNYYPALEDSHSQNYYQYY